MSVAIGDKAPAFTLLGSGSQSYSLSDFAGKLVVLVFYPGDNTPVCTKQLCSYNNELASFSNLGAQVLAISAQGIESHDAFSTKHGFGFPLLADTDKSVAKSYGILGLLGMVRRSVFVVDKNGIIRYAHRSLTGVTFRPVDELVSAINLASA